MIRYVCIDESGSFHTKSERYYIVAGYVTSNLLSLRSMHRKKELLVREVKKGNKELKAANIKDSQKAIFINSTLDFNDVVAIAIVVDKSKLQFKREFIITEFMLYNFIVKELIKYGIENGLFDVDDNLILNVDDRSMNEKVVHDLESYLNLEFFDYFKNVEVNFLDSSKFREIQLADYLANSIYGLFNKTNTAYNLIEKKNKVLYKVFPF